MSTNDLLTDVSSCTEFINQYLNTDLVEIQECHKKFLEIFDNFVEKTNEIKRVLLDTTSLDEIRLMQITMKENLEFIKHYHRSTVCPLIERLSQFNESLKIKADAIKISISRTDQSFIEQHSLSEFAHWIEGIQSCQYVLHLKLNHTVNSILEITNQYEQDD